MAETVTISEKWLGSLKAPATGRLWYADKDLRSFQVCLTHTGRKVFYRVGRVNGKMTRLRIGVSPDLAAKVARDKCIELNGDIAAGRSVVRTKRSTVSVRTLADSWEWYLEFYARPFKRTWERDVNVWNRDLKHLGGLKLADVTRPMVIELVAKVTAEVDATTGKARGPGAGNKVIELVRAIYNVCIENEWCTKNPAKKIAKHKSQAKDRFLLPEELPTFFASLASFRQRIQDFFLLCIFTGARRANIMAMRWDELDMERGLWVIPHSKSKTKRPIVLPLADQPRAILARRLIESRGSDWVFPSTKSPTGHYNEPKDAWRRILERAVFGYKDEQRGINIPPTPSLHNLTIHDLRRTLASWQAGMGVSLPIIGKTLGNRSQAVIEVYARVANEPARIAVQNAINAIETAAVEKKTEKS